MDQQAWSTLLQAGLVLVANVGIVLLLLNPSAMAFIASPLSFLRLRKYARSVGRSVVVVTHGTKGGGLFGSMLDMKDVVKVERFLRKADGAPVDVVLTTFGGSLIAGLRLARLLKRYGDVRVVVPKYAFSAGTLASIAAPVLMAHPDAMFGPVDPQLGGLLEGVHSAKDWQAIRSAKGAASRDATVAHAEVSRRLMGEMRGYVLDLLPPAADGPGVLALLLDGDASHARAISPAALALVGLPVGTTDLALAGELVERSGDGVRAYYLRAGKGASA